MISILLQTEYFKTVGNKTEKRISKRVFQENKACPIFRKRNIFYPLIRTRTYIRTYACTRTYIHTRTCAYQGVKNVCFSENLTCFCSLETPVLIFTLLPYYRWNIPRSSWYIWLNKYHKSSWSVGLLFGLKRKVHYDSMIKTQTVIMGIQLTLTYESFQLIIWTVFYVLFLIPSSVNVSTKRQSNG